MLSKKLTNLKSFILVFGFLLLFFPFEVKADVVMPLDPYYSLSVFMVILILAFITNLFINAIILVISYLIIKQKNLVKFGKFLSYIAFVTIGGLIIDFICVYLMLPFLFVNIFNLSIFLTSISSFLLISLSLGIYNYWLSRNFFNLSKKQAVFIGIIMGIFTNPLLLTRGIY